MPVLFGVILLDIAGFGILLPSIMYVLQNMGSGPAYATVIIAMYSIGQFFSGPLWGRLSDRIGRKPVLMIAMSGACFAYILMAMAKTPEMILVSRIIAGLMAGNIATAYAAVADLTPPENRAKGMGVLGAAFGLGFVVGPAIGGFLGGNSPETATIFYPAIASAIMSCLALIATALFFKESLNVDHQIALLSKPQIGRIEALKKVVLHPILFRFCLFVFLVAISSSLMEPVLPLLVGDRYGWGPLHMGYIFTVVGLLIAIVQGGLIGWLSKSLGEKNMVKLAFIMIILGLTIIIITPISYGVVGGLALTGVGQALFTTSISALTSHRAAPTERGLVMGVVQSMQSLGRSIGPTVAGALYVFWEGLPYFVGILLITSALVWMVLLTRTMNIEDATDQSAS